MTYRRVIKMKGDSAGWNSRQGFGNMSTPTRPFVSDYRVTTMKIRDQVLKGKPKTTKYYRNMRSMSTFQNRNLDNYPMPHGREDAVRSASGHREARRERQDGMNRARLDSEKLREHSKQMFDGVVKRVQKNGAESDHNKTNDKRTRLTSENLQNGYRSTVSSRLSQRGKGCEFYSECARNNGPSRDGSVLYDSRQMMLNAIRTRPHSEPVGIFNHEKNKCKPGLNEAISEKNVNYTVRPNRSSLYSRAGSVACSVLTGSMCSSTDYVLVPLNDTFKDIDRRFSMDISLSDLNDSLETDRDTFDEDSVFKPAFSRRESQMLPPSASHGIRLVSLDEDSLSESEEEAVPKPVQTSVASKKADAVTPHKAADKGARPHVHFEEPGDEARGQRATDPEPEVKPVHVKIQLKGPHCWVDDATITSDTSEQEQTDQTGSPRDSKKQEVGKTPLVKRTSQQELCKTENVNKIEIERQTAIIDEVAVDETTDTYSFPPFLCPSSEKKSREAAIKDWLAHTCFQTAHRGVPML